MVGRSVRVDNLVAGQMIEVWSMADGTHRLPRGLCPVDAIITPEEGRLVSTLSPVDNRRKNIPNTTTNNDRVPPRPTASRKPGDALPNDRVPRPCPLGRDAVVSVQGTRSEHSPRPDQPGRGHEENPMTDTPPLWPGFDPNADNRVAAAWRDLWALTADGPLDRRTAVETITARHPLTAKRISNIVGDALRNRHLTETIHDHRHRTIRRATP